MEIIRRNKALMAEIDRIAEVAGYLWTKGWAERNGGNISVNVTHLMDDESKCLPALAPTRPLNEVRHPLPASVSPICQMGMLKNCPNRIMGGKRSLHYVRRQTA